MEKVFVLFDFAAVGCTNSASNNDGNSTQIENEVKPGDDQEDLPIDMPDEDSTEELPTEPEEPSEPETPAEPEEPTEPETPTEPEEPTDEPTEPEITQYSITFEIVTAFEDFITKECFDCPMELTKLHPEFEIESNEGMVQYISKDFGMTQYAIHFKNKDGKAIVTTEKDGKQYLEFDFYHTAMNDVYFSINGEEYRVENSGGIVFKQTFSIEISENSTFSLDLDRM